MKSYWVSKLMWDEKTLNKVINDYPDLELKKDNYVKVFLAQDAIKDREELKCYLDEEIKKVHDELMNRKTLEDRTIAVVNYRRGEIDALNRVKKKFFGVKEDKP